MQNFRALGVPPPDPRTPVPSALPPNPHRSPAALPPDPQNSPPHCEFLAKRLVTRIVFLLWLHYKSTPDSVRR